MIISKFFRMFALAAMSLSAMVTANAEVAPYTLLSNENTTLTFYYGEKPEGAMGIVATGGFIKRIPWNSAAGTIEKVVFDASFANYDGVKTTEKWFNGCKNLTTITGLENLNTSSVTTMASMFANCESLTTLDLSSFKTANVTSFYYFLKGCKNLKTVNVSSFSLSKAEDLRYMFSECESLEAIDLSNFTTDPALEVNYNDMFDGCKSLTQLDMTKMFTDNTLNLYGVFKDCSSLKTVDISTWNTSKVSQMKELFSGCTSLTTVYVGNGWSTESVKIEYEEDGVTVKSTQGDDMFAGCTAIVGGQGTAYDANHTNYQWARIDGGSETPGYFTGVSLEPYAILNADNTKLSFFYGRKPEGAMDVNPISRSYGFFTIVSVPWGDQAETIKTVEFDASFGQYHGLRSVEKYFYNFKNLTDIIGMQYFNTENVTNMKSMFSSCEQLKSVDLSHFNTSKVTSTYWMFYGCKALESIDVTNFDMMNVEDVRYMFYECESLKSIDLSHFETNPELEVNYNDMFGGCKSLIELDMTKMRTDNTLNMFGVFENCSSLKTIDISTWNTSKVSQMTELFVGCSSLTTIYAGDGWSTESVKIIYEDDGVTVKSTQGDRMFLGCSSLVGGAGTVLDFNNIDYKWARIDGGKSAPGYFTYKATDGISTIRPVIKTNDDSYYTIGGHRVDKNYKGIVVKNGKKFLNK